MALIVPTTTKNKLNKYYFNTRGANDKIYKACISQIKIISAKRLLRKIDTINKIDSCNLLNHICRMINGTL